MIENASDEDSITRNDESSQKSSKKRTSQQISKNKSQKLNNEVDVDEFDVNLFSDTRKGMFVKITTTFAEFDGSSSQLFEDLTIEGFTK